MTSWGRTFARISLAFVVATAGFTAEPAQAADVVLRGDESMLFVRRTDGLWLIEFRGPISTRSDVTGLNCNVQASQVAIVGTEAMRRTYLDMMLASQSFDIPARVFITDRDAVGRDRLCTVDTIRMSKGLPL